MLVTVLARVRKMIMVIMIWNQMRFSSLT